MCSLSIQFSYECSVKKLKEGVCLQQNSTSLYRAAEVHTGSLFPAERKMFETRLACSLKCAKKNNLKYILKIYSINSYLSHSVECQTVKDPRCLAMFLYPYVTAHLRSHLQRRFLCQEKKQSIAYTCYTIRMIVLTTSSLISLCKIL